MSESRLTPPGYLLSRDLIKWLHWHADEAQIHTALAEILMSAPGSSFGPPEDSE